MKHFRTVSAISEAGEDELTAVKGMSKAAAKAVQRLPAAETLLMFTARK